MKHLCSPLLLVLGWLLPASGETIYRAGPILWLEAGSDHQTLHEADPAWDNFEPVDADIFLILPEEGFREIDGGSGWALDGARPGVHWLTIVEEYSGTHRIDNWQLIIVYDSATLAQRQESLPTGTAINLDLLQVPEREHFIDDIPPQLEIRGDPGSEPFFEASSGVETSTTFLFAEWDGPLLGRAGSLTAADSFFLQEITLDFSDAPAESPPGEEPGPPPDPTMPPPVAPSETPAFPGDHVFGGGWFYNEWLSHYFRGERAGETWLWQPHLGWLLKGNSAGPDYWFWNANFGWFYFGQETGGLAYLERDSEWVVLRLRADGNSRVATLDRRRSFTPRSDVMRTQVVFLDNETAPLRAFIRRTNAEGKAIYSGLKVNPDDNYERYFYDIAMFQTDGEHGMEFRYDSTGHLMSMHFSSGHTMLVLDQQDKQIVQAFDPQGHYQEGAVFMRGIGSGQIGAFSGEDRAVRIGLTQKASDDLRRTPDADTSDLDLLEDVKNTLNEFIDAATEAIDEKISPGLGRFQNLINRAIGRTEAISDFLEDLDEDFVFEIDVDFEEVGVFRPQGGPTDYVPEDSESFEAAAEDQIRRNQPIAQYSAETLRNYPPPFQSTQNIDYGDDDGSGGAPAPSPPTLGFDPDPPPSPGLDTITGDVELLQEASSILIENLFEDDVELTFPDNDCSDGQTRADGNFGERDAMLDRSVQRIADAESLLGRISDPDTFFLPDDGGPAFYRDELERGIQESIDNLDFWRNVWAGRGCTISNYDEVMDGLQARLNALRNRSAPPPNPTPEPGGERPEGYDPTWDDLGPGGATWVPWGTRPLRWTNPPDHPTLFEAVQAARAEELK